jgi:hypothetical protein
MTTVQVDQSFIHNALSCVESVHAHLLTISCLLSREDFSVLIASSSNQGFSNCTRSFRCYASRLWRHDNHVTHSVDTWLVGCAVWCYYSSAKGGLPLIVLEPDLWKFCVEVLVLCVYVLVCVHEIGQIWRQCLGHWTEFTSLSSWFFSWVKCVLTYLVQQMVMFCCSYECRYFKYVRSLVDGSSEAVDSGHGLLSATFVVMAGLCWSGMDSWKWRVKYVGDVLDQSDA